MALEVLTCQPLRLDLVRVLMVAVRLSCCYSDFTMWTAEFRFCPGNRHRVNASVECISVTLREFMTSESHSPYTSFVSVGNATKLCQFDFHCRRLIEGLRTLRPSTNILPYEDLKTQLKDLIASIPKHLEIYEGMELQFVVILSSETHQNCIRVHATPFPSPRLNQLQVSSAVVECRWGRRHLPAVKDTAWYTERAPLEEARSETTNETILMTKFDPDDPVLLEGLVTNFFVVTQNLEVWTANDQLVLPGSVRKLVLHACTELKVAVVEKAVPLRSWRLYEAAFLTNARRLLQPVRAIEVPDCVRDRFHDVPAIISFQEGSKAFDLVQRLRRQVALIMENTAERIRE